MDYTCFNCDEQIEIAETLTSIDENNCPNCFTYLHLEIYDKCANCNQFYLNTYHLCPDCFGYSYAESFTEEEHILPPLQYEYIDSEEKYLKAVEELSYLEKIALDTEGNSLSPFTNELLLIQLGNEDMVYIFDFNWHDRLSKEYFWKDPEKLFIIQNALYDYKVLKYNAGIEVGKVFDTLLAERILTCGISRNVGLKSLTEKYLNLEMDKKIRMDFIDLTKETFHQKVTKELIEYSARDVQVLCAIYDQQNRELIRENLSRIAQIEFDVVRVIGEMELRGIYVDTERWRKIIVARESEKVELKNKLHEELKRIGFETDLFGNLEVNLNSTKELKAIFKRVGINLESTGDAELAAVDHPIAALLREYRKCEKQLSSFGESFLKFVRKETSRVHPSFQQIGADTGRFSCNKPNLQQIPATEEFRSCFAAPNGRKIVTCDYSQQELRVLASLSGDPKFIQLYLDGVDLHTATASMMFGIPIDEVQKDKRSVAKTINFGLAYGRGAKALAQVLVISEEEGKEMIEKYFSQFTFIRDWLEGAAKSAQELGYSKTILGRKRFYILPDKKDPEYRSKLAAIGRQGKNSPIQGSGVDMVKMALTLIHEQLTNEKLDAFLINTVHDEIVIESCEKDAERAKEIIEHCMVEAGKRICSNVPILADPNIGDYWFH
jgi:DNA polymerase I